MNWVIKCILVTAVSSLLVGPAEGAGLVVSKTKLVVQPWYRSRTMKVISYAALCAGVVCGLNKAARGSYFDFGFKPRGNGKELQDWIDKNLRTDSGTGVCGLCGVRRPSKSVAALAESPRATSDTVVPGGVPANSEAALSAGPRWMINFVLGDIVGSVEHYNSTQAPQSKQLISDSYETLSNFLLKLRMARSASKSAIDGFLRKRFNGTNCEEILNFIDDRRNDMNNELIEFKLSKEQQAIYKQRYVEELAGLEQETLVSLSTRFNLPSGCRYPRKQLHAFCKEIIAFHEGQSRAAASAAGGSAAGATATSTGSSTAAGAV